MMPRTVATTMQKLDPMSEKNDVPEAFITAVNGHITQINEQIDVYNSALATNEERIQSLRNIQKYQEEMDAVYALNLITISKGYQEQIHKRLFTALQTHLASHQQPLYTPRIGPTHSAYDFSMLLGTMPPEKISDLATILTRSKRKQLLRSLYTEGEEGSAAYHAFLETHAIKFLGGCNAQIFKITRQSDNQPFVLKMEQRIGASRAMEYQLKQQAGMADLFSPIYAERQTTHKKSSKTTTSTLMLTAYYPHGDLQAHAKQQTDDHLRMGAALTLFSQMAQILSDLEQHQCLHPDIKNSNWLIDNEGNLRIGDTKSLLAARRKPDSNVVWIKNKETVDDLIQTEGMISPQLNIDPSSPSRGDIEISVQKSYSYMLGKNLYLYLLQGSIDVSGNFLDRDGNIIVPNNDDTHDAGHYNFNAPIFTIQPTGQALVELIKALVKPHPTERMDLSATLEKLQQLQQLQLLKNNCLKILDQISQLKISTATDSHMQRFKDAQTNLINAASLKDLQDIKKQLEKHLEQQEKVVHAVRTIIEEFRGSITCLSIQKKKKADNIEKTFLAIPVEQRNLDALKEGEELTDNREGSMKTRRFREALAYRRRLIGEHVVLNSNQTINVEKAATSYHRFFNALSKPTPTETPVPPDAESVSVTTTDSTVPSRNV